MHQISLVRTNLTTVGIESALYGIFFVLTASSITLTLYRVNRLRGSSAKGRRPLQGAVHHSLWRQPMSYGTFGLAITVTAHWVLTFFRLFQAFVLVDGGNSAEEFYGDLRTISLVIKTVFLFASLILCDSLIIYRLWIVWNHNYYVIIFPIFTLIGLTVCGIGLPVQLASFTPDLTIFANQAGRWILSDCIFTLCGMSYGAKNLMSILGIFVESAAIYTAWTIFVFVTYLSGSNIQFLGSDIWPYSAGIAFMLINVRVSLGWAATAQQSTFAALNMADTIATITGGDVVFENRSHATGYPMRPVAVNISQATEVIGEGDEGMYEPGKERELDLSKGR
ncbi:hypothetical protein J3R30DRAFT_3303297 [Lentinula aciculospora]|uniref:Uncharacterized protein n=1 Tax=Lentinula aciculospora TaxID=153920 RepID=A0A9W9DHN8_9AGAR|nr:hypothetical protein J3R30DRAFT_3303297 [Lentinula aciculospora]